MLLMLLVPQQKTTCTPRVADAAPAASAEPIHTSTAANPYTPPPPAAAAPPLAAAVANAICFLCPMTAPTFNFPVTSARVFVPPRCLDDIWRCGVYGTFAMAYHDM
jgi:hypothetical protein